MRAFLVACLATVVVGAGGYYWLNSLQQPTGIAFATGATRITPQWSWRADCDPRTPSEWFFLDFGTPKGEPSACKVSQ